MRKKIHKQIPLKEDPWEQSPGRSLRETMKGVHVNPESWGQWDRVERKESWRDSWAPWDHCCPNTSSPCVHSESVTQISRVANLWIFFVYFNFWITKAHWSPDWAFDCFKVHMISITNTLVATIICFVGVVVSCAQVDLHMSI